MVIGSGHNDSGKKNYKIANNEGRNFVFFTIVSGFRNPAAGL